MGPRPEAGESASSLAKRRVAFVELPDEDAGIVIHGYCDAGDWETSLIVASRPDSRAARIGRLLDVPVLPQPTRESLARCDRVVVGNAAPEVWAGISDLLVGLPVEMLPLTQVRREGERPADASPVGGSPMVVREPEATAALARAGGARPAPETAEMPGVGPGAEAEGTAEPYPKRDVASKSVAAVASPAGATAEIAVPGEAPAPAQLLPPPVTPGVDPGASGFHAATILGAEIAGHNLPLALDGEEPRVVELLQRALAETKARTASLMLVDRDGEHLRVAAVQGHDAAEVRGNRQAPGAGLAGRAFVTTRPQISRGVIPCLAEQVGGTRYRVSVSYPVVLDRAPIGVLSINGEWLEEVPDEELLRVLRRHANAACRALLSAVRIEGIETRPSQVALQCLVDRLMSLEEALSVRIGFLAEALGKVLGADYAQSYLVDPMNGRLVALGAGGGITSQGATPISRGLFGWVVRHGIPQVLESANADGTDQVATICYPIVSTHPHSLIVLENVPLRRMSRTEVVRLLSEIVEQVEGMIAVEEAMAIQDLVADLDMRIADQTADLNRLPPYHQRQAILELALELTTAEAAVWMPGPGGQPTMSRPATRRAAGVLLEAWNHLELVAAAVRERGTAASGFSGEGWEADVAECPLPYIGVRDANGDGVLLVFYSAQETAGAPAQVPLHVLWKVLRGLCERLPREDSAAAAGRPRGESAEGADGFAASMERFAELVQAERRRSRHTGRPFALARIRLPGGAAPPEVGTLRAFLLRSRRDIDTLCAPEPGLFLLLWPEPESDPEAMLGRLFDQWAQEHPGISWDASHCTSTGLEAEDVGVSSWLEDQVAARRSA